MRHPHGLRASLASQAASQVTILLSGNGTNNSTNFIDSSVNNFTVTAVGNAKISTAQSKFGGSSILLDGNGDWLQIPNTEISDTANADFTVEAWVYQVGNSGTQALWATGWPNALYIDAGTLIAVAKDNVNAADPNLFSDGSLSGTSISLNTWTHVAYTRSANTFRLFQGGIKRAETTISSGQIAGSTASYIGIGKNSVVAATFNGYIDDFRVTKGLARYTANFAPPTEALTNT